jgi:hypothetical protein
MRRNYDAIDVGSGAVEIPMFQLEAHAPLHGARTPDKPFDFYDAMPIY